MKGRYDAGYGRPPKATRFKPGQSGNPKGRPKKARSLAAALKKVLSQDLLIRENGKPIQVSSYEALVKSIYAEAIKGNPKAWKTLLDMMSEVGMFRVERRVSEKELPESNVMIYLPAKQQVDETS